MKALSHSYRRYLTSPLWRIHRAIAFVFWGVLFGHGRCAACGRFKLVQGHHMTYKDLGHELPWQVLPLSRGCHGIVTWLGNRLVWLLGAKRARVLATWLWVAVRGWWFLRLWPLWAVLAFRHYHLISFAVLWHPHVVGARW